MAERLTQVPVPVIPRQGRRRRKFLDPVFYGAIRRDFELQAQLRALEPDLREAKTLIAARAGAIGQGKREMTVTLEVGSMLCTISKRHKALVPEENLRALKKTLGRYFSRRVGVRKHLASTRELLVTGADEALSLLTLKELAPQFRWAFAKPPRI